MACAPGGPCLQATHQQKARARGMMQLARDTGLTREGLYKALGEQGNPSFSTVIKAMHALGLQFHVGARQANG